MCTQPRSISRLAIIFLILTLPPVPLLAGDQPVALTNDAVLQMIRWQMSDAEIIAVIDRNDTRFDLSPSTVALLKSSGVHDPVLEAMWKATLKSSKTAQPASAPAHAAPAPPQTNPAPQTMPPPKPVPAHTQERLDTARRTPVATPDPGVPQHSCPPLAPGGKTPPVRFQADWDTGGIAPASVDHSGPSCFEVRNFNDILYIPVFTLTEIPPQGSDVDLLREAMGALTGLFSGAGAGSVAGRKLAAPKCPANLGPELEAALKAAAALEDAVTQLDPGRDSNGKINYVPLATTLARWQPVPGKYDAFEKATAQVVLDLNLAGTETCPKEILASAEALVIEGYVPARKAYSDLKRNAGSDHIARYSGDMEPTSAYDFVVKPTYGGTGTAAGSKTFHLNAGRKILTSSAGFLITQLPARSYSSRTVPTGTNNSATQNVLGVDFGNGPRPALTVLLNYHVFFADWHRFGLALSAGPVFDISSGKADTSRLGFFGGVSLHMWNRLFVTPGVHFGEFADFPQGFVKGSIIPPNTGTPQASKRYTARFAVGVTFKVKDLGEAPAKSNSNPASSGSGSSGAGGSGSGGSGRKHDKKKRRSSAQG